VRQVSHGKDVKVREMRTAETILNIIQDRGKRKLPLPVIKDQVITPYPRMRSEIIERLLHDTCEVCGSKEHIEMHHIRKLADLNKEGRREKPLWMKIMISRKRKSMPLCRRCHDDIHANRPKSTRQGNRRAG
jgi:hypothetical protein